MGRQYTPRAQYLRSCYRFILASLLPRFFLKPLGPQPGAAKISSSPPPLGNEAFFFLKWSVRGVEDSLVTCACGSRRECTALRLTASTARP